MSDTPMFEHHPEAGLWVEPSLFEWVDDIPVRVDVLEAYANPIDGDGLGGDAYEPVVSKWVASAPPGPCPHCAATWLVRHSHTL